MTDDAISRSFDKATWGDGPWTDEPDRVEWTHAGLPCLALRGPHGHWCGYAAVPPGHPLHGKDYDTPDVDVHGGLTYAGKCSGRICHVPQPGESDDVFWFGFDCGHAGDFMPGMAALLRTFKIPDRLNQPYDHAAALAGEWWVDKYRTLDYVQAEVNRLAEQLAAVVRADARSTRLDDAGSPSPKGVD